MQKLFNIHVGCILFLLVLTNKINAQVPSHNMGTYTVTDCRAKFYDDGGPATPYLSILNTVITKTLCIFVGSQITMTFNPSGLQTQIQSGDFISFYDGPNNLSPLLGSFTNINGINIIPTIVAPSGSLTVIWSENGNTVGHGWNGGWYSLSIPPTPPTATLATVPNCNASIITLTTTQGVLCDSLKPNYFTVSGAMVPGVTSVSPVPCSNGTTQVIQINLTQPLNLNCNYIINFTLFRKDNCDSVYKYPGQVATFSINTCPFTASINVTPIATLCVGDCTTLTAVPQSSCLTYNYQWSHGPTGAGPHVVCPTLTTVYSVTLTEVTTLSTAVATRTIYVLDPNITPLMSNTVCQSAGNINLTATPLGGYWYGPGISPSNSLTGIFNPYVSGPGTFWIKYRTGNCKDSIQITVLAINAGSSDAACTGGPSFTVSGGTPFGGFWSGDPHITGGGVFTPTAVGIYTVTYNYGPCTQNKLVYVNTLTVPATSYTICKSVWYKYLNSMVGPPGGRFTGTGITNNVIGTFSPALAGPGTHVITYSLANGCFSTFSVQVLDIYAVPVATTCPSHIPFTVPTASPSGGLWTCTFTPSSIQNAVTGMYNPSAAGITSHTDILIYTAPNGCTDTLVMKALVTTMVSDSLFFCDNNDSLRLSNNLLNFNYSPTGGVFSGPGVVFQSGNYYFKPKVTGQGIYTIYYDINTCRDSIKMVVYPAMISGFNATLCSTHPTVMVVSPPLPFGTNWTGVGITTASLGIFNPGSVIAGNNYTLTYTNRGGCSNTVEIYVYQFLPSVISNLNNVYCFKNTNISYSVSPPNGTLVAVNSMTNLSFNPSILGAGNYTVSYSFGIGACLTSTTILVKIHPQLTTTTTNSSPTICVGESSKLTVKGSGGLPSVSQYTYSWSNNLLPFTNQNVIPNATTVYTVITSDGCSDDVIDTLRVLVYPSFYASFNTLPKQCYGTSGQATVNISPTGNFSYAWNTTPVQTTNIINGSCGKNYIVTLKNLATGCKKDTSLIIPGYNAIQALFSPNPNLNCIPFEENMVTFLDLSNGAVSGNWNVNGLIVPYVPGQSISHLFDSPGNYNVTLNAVNDGNCPSSFSLPICILESENIFIPDIFSPNKDGNNEIFYVRSNGIKEMRFAIYDRWGTKIFESTDVNKGWDGTYNGKNAEAGVYAYYLDAILYTDKKLVKKGDVTLIR